MLIGNFTYHSELRKESRNARNRLVQKLETLRYRSGRQLNGQPLGRKAITMRYLLPVAIPLAMVYLTRYYRIHVA